jgi:hypothetical protein
VPQVIPRHLRRGAQNGARTSTGIACTVVCDIEKEVGSSPSHLFIYLLHDVTNLLPLQVILLEPAPGTDPNASLQTDEPNLRVLKVIRKTEIEALCAQHNAVRPSPSPPPQLKVNPFAPRR